MEIDQSKGKTMTAHRYFLSLVFNTYLGCFLGSNVKADDTYFATTSVYNPTGGTIYYQFRWGNEADWKNFSVPPGSSKVHYHEYAYPNQNSSPTPQIRFDYIAGDDDVNYKTYNLTANAAPCIETWASKRYIFRYFSCGQYLDLRSRD
jgi:hypothetical protein